MTIKAAIVNTLLMAVFERRREMGILAALGMKGRQILTMFLLEAATLGVAGIALGILWSGLVVTYVGSVGWEVGGATGIYGSTIYTVFSVPDTVSLSVKGLIITLLASLYPALFAARIELQDVTRVYRIGEVETHALRGVTLTIEEGEFTAIVGPSGSGKTTLLQLLGCLDKPTSGTMRVKGQNVTKLNANQRADLRKGTIGFIFQFFALIPGLTAYENVELPLLLTGEKANALRERVNELLSPGHPSRPGAGRRANG
jgi:ABC-type multidrug transport system fused ATPase/permease subunit